MRTLLMLYGFITLFIFILSLILATMIDFENPTNRRRSSVMALTAPLWPVILLALLIFFSLPFRTQNKVMNYTRKRGWA